MHNLIYGGVNSEDYKAYITNAGLYKSPEKRYKKHTIPGRNGDLLEDTGTYENVEVEYPICVYENCDKNLQDFVAAMRRKKGYQRIEDTFHPEYYRMGAFLDEFEPKRVTEDAEMCNGVLKFDCMPQKFLKSGDEPIVVFEGNFYNYVSSSDEPDIPSNAVMTTGLIFAPRNKTINVKLHNEKNDARVYIIVYNAQEQEIDNFFLIPEYERWLPAGDYDVDITLPSGTSRWQFRYEVDGDSIGEIVTVGETYAKFTYEDLGIEESRFITAILKEELRIKNPTGYNTKPLIEYYARNSSNIKITNIENDVEKDFYELALERTNPMPTEHIFLDCDQQYVYGSNGQNMSNIMSIITAERADGKSLVFPEFGADTIKIEFLHHNEEPILVPTHNVTIFIYPRWWIV